MLYTPERLGRTRIGDFLDAMAGHNEGENEKRKSIAELVRMSTTILFNIQLAEGDRLTPHELWPFAWDKEESGEQGEVSDEDRKEFEERQAEMLKKM